MPQKNIEYSNSKIIEFLQALVVSDIGSGVERKKNEQEGGHRFVCS